MYGIYKTKSPTQDQIEKYKITEREIFEKYANLSENELNAKNSKEVYAKIDVMTTVIKRCERKIDGIEKKLTIQDSEISDCPEHEVKLNIGKISVNEKILEEYSIKIYEIDPYFYERYRKKIQVDENGHKYILFRIDAYFTECLLALEIDEKRLTDRDIRKKIGCKFIRINTSK